MQRLFTFVFLLIVLSKLAGAQNDTIVSVKGDQLVGEIKSLEKGVLILKTDYSDKDFNIEWDHIEELITDRTFLIFLADGRRINGSIRSHKGDSLLVQISTLQGSLLIDDLLDIIFLKPLEQSFLGRLDASIEIGYTYTKAHNHHQFSSRSNLGYLADVWGVNGSFDIIRSRQDSVAETRRTDASIGVRTIFKNSWYLSLSNNFLQSDEQKLRLRSITNLSFGHLLINSHKAYWATGAGFAYNFESYTTDETNDISLEGLISNELNMFAYEDISLLTTLLVYPSITMKGRVRSDLKFDIKYDLPLDFFIKLGFSHNFDNQPATDAEKHDYIIQTTIGWEL